jgi:hypothetical protein
LLIERCDGRGAFAGGYLCGGREEGARDVVLAEDEFLGGYYVLVEWENRWMRRAAVREERGVRNGRLWRVGVGIGV